MRLRVFGLVLAAAAFPAIASADATPQPNYPPGWDCSAVAAGSQRQACNRSQLNPPMDTVPTTKRNQPALTIQRPQPPILPTVKPPTIPRLPGTIEYGK